jgi:hypothetical protein
VGKPMDMSLSIEEIEGTRWGHPPSDATRLVVTAYRLRREPIGELTVEDLRLLIGQQIGTDVLVSRALDILRESPLAEGDMVEGDLLCSVLRVQGDFWSARPELAAAVEAVVARIVAPPAAVSQEIERWRAARHGR